MMINYAANRLLVVILRNESVLNDTPFICKIAVGSLRDLLRLNFMPQMLPNQLGKWIQKSHSYIGNMVCILKWDSHRLVRVAENEIQRNLGPLFQFFYKFVMNYKEKGMATHSTILAWGIPWTKEHGGLEFVGSKRVEHDRAINTFTKDYQKAGFLTLLVKSFLGVRH